MHKVLRIRVPPLQCSRCPAVFLCCIFRQFGLSLQIDLPYITSSLPKDAVDQYPLQYSKSASDTDHKHSTADFKYVFHRIDARNTKIIILSICFVSTIKSYFTPPYSSPIGGWTSSHITNINHQYIPIFF